MREASFEDTLRARADRRSQSARNGCNRRHRRSDRPGAPRAGRARRAHRPPRGPARGAPREPGRARRGSYRATWRSATGPRGLRRRRAHVDVLVANAALPASGRLEDFDPEEIDRALDVNLRAPMQLTRALLPGMLSAAAGTWSWSRRCRARSPRRRSGVYSATKFGLRGFAAGLREDVEPSGIGVTVVFPGFVSEAGFFADSGVKLPRWVGTRTPEQVAAAVVQRGRAGARGARRGAARPASGHAPRGARAGHCRAHPAAARLRADRGRARRRAAREALSAVAPEPGIKI